MSQVERDGSTLTAILTAALIDKGADALDAGFAVADVVGGIEDAARSCRVALKGMAQPLAAGQLLEIATTAAMDADLARAVADSVERAGREGIVTIEPALGDQVSIVASEGMVIDRGFVRAEFATDPTGQMAYLDDCFVLLHNARVTDYREIVPVLEKISPSRRPLLLIAYDLNGEALATLMLNHQREVVRSVAVRAPGFDARRDEMLRDLAVYTGARLIDRTIGMSLKSATLEDLGTARTVTVTRDQTTILGGGGSEEQVEARAAMIRGQIEGAVGDYEREKLQERLALLRGRIVTIGVGGSTESVRADRLQRGG